MKNVLALQSIMVTKCHLWNQINSFITFFQHPILSLIIYSLEGGASWVDGIAILNFVENESFFGRFQNEAFQEGELQSNNSSLYEKGASIDSLAGNYASENLNLTIDAKGHISGSKSGCDINGEVSAPDANFNMYEINYTLSGAWWKDGHRCGIDIGLLPSGTCKDCLIDTGMTYEEWKSGKWEAEKIVENIGDEIIDAADDGIEFIKDTASDVIGAIKSWW